MAQRIISFELTMPNKGSWNGKWSGENQKYYLIKKMPDRFLSKQEHLRHLLMANRDSWYYNFGDGWGANVTAEIIDGTQAAQRKKVSKGFCGYDWMVESIIHKGKIEIKNI